MLKPSLLLALMIVGAVSPAMAATAAERYGNARFGYWVTIPAGFTCGDESDNGDGKSCTSADGAAKLAVWGGYTGTVADDGFSGEVKFDMKSDADDGLKITYAKMTSSWASYSGTDKDGQIVYRRMISGCKDSQYAAFELTYPPSEAAAMKPVVEQLVPSLKQETCSAN